MLGLLPRVVLFKAEDSLLMLLYSGYGDCTRLPAVRNKSVANYPHGSSYSYIRTCESSLL